MIAPQLDGLGLLCDGRQYIFLDTISTSLSHRVETSMTRELTGVNGLTKHTIEF